MKNKKTIFMIIGILAVIALGFGVTYAWLTLTLNGTKNNVLKIGTLSLVLDDTTGEGINVEGTVPMLDEIGLTLDPYTFTLTNNGTIESEYTIYLDDVDLETGEERVDDSKMKYDLVKDGQSVRTGLVSSIGTNPDRILETGKIAVNESHQYELRLWVDSEAGNEVMGKVFRGKIRVEASQVIQDSSPDAHCYTFEKETGMITDYAEMSDETCSRDVQIPTTIGGVKVTAIGNYAFAENGITSVVIPEGIISIGRWAFEANLISTVTIPKSVMIIDNGAFSANQLTSVVIKGKANSSAFTSYGSDIFGWTSGYSDANITWNG